MSVFRTSTLGDIARGGQTTLHFFRMIGQVIFKFVGFVIFLMAVFFVTYLYAQTTAYERYVLFKWSQSSVSVALFNDVEERTAFKLKDGNIINPSKRAVIAGEYINTVVDKFIRLLIRGSAYTAVTIGFVFLLVFFIIYRTGFAIRQENFLRGGKIVEPGELRRQLKAQKIASDIEIGGVPLKLNSELKHMLLTGSHGAGKSTAIKQVLRAIRKRGDRAIVYSTSGEFVENFYREDKDIILNPLDERSPAWNIWCEGRAPSDFNSMAASLIPEAKGNQDPFWIQAARSMFSNVAMRMYTEGDLSTPQLLRNLLTVDLDEAAALVKGTEAAAIISEGSEKTALSVRATLAACIQYLKYLKHEGDSFSIRDWVRDDDKDNWVFITSRPDQKETLKPLITTWLDVASTAILSREPDLDRRIWLIIDELPSLNQLPMLSDMLAQSRKFGGCCVLGFQSYSQLISIYGKEGASAITGLCATWVVYRANEPDTAEWASRGLGNEELMETAEGISYGANEIRDGLSLSMNRKTRPLVLPTEMMTLADLEGYIRLEGDLPRCRFNTKWQPMKKIAPGYIEADLAKTSWDFSETTVTKPTTKNESEVNENLGVSEEAQSKKSDKGKKAVTDDMFRDI